MQGAAVIPDHQIMHAPRMAINKLALRGVLGEVANQHQRLRPGHAVDGADVGS